MALRLVTDLEMQTADVAAVAAVAPTAAVAAVAPSMTASEVATLVSLFQTMLDRTERNILDRLDVNSRGAHLRWEKHDAELVVNTKRVTDKFLAIEKRLDDHLVIANAHFAREHDEDLVMQARIRPIRTGGAWIMANWKTVGLILAMFVGWFLLGVESIEHLSL